ncbi:hypothetical protein ACNI65_06525 [Roseateles sp. So40a]|uniref:hypothetical protein n=1 Tax=Roseateles sp. So40a TaxID=3400226 RepID=UPI003A84208C
MSKSRIERSAVADQVIGAAVNGVNLQRLSAEQAAQALQDASFDRAMEHVGSMRDFLGSPEKIIGNIKTKHGEIAEALEVHITNARRSLDGQAATATLDVPGGRIGMADYSIDGVDFQSKFHNNFKDGLAAFSSHAEKYPDFLGSGGKYTLPKDQFGKLIAIANGDPVPGVKPGKAEEIRAWLADLEAKTGKPFTETVQPGIPTYADVQQGAIHDTVDQHEQELWDRNYELKDEIHLDHQASWSEGLKVAGQAAVIAGGITFATQVWAFHKEGRNLFKGELTAEDWKSLGLEVSTSASVGAVTAGGIYLATNFAGMAAPLAAAVASAAKGVGSLAWDYRKGRITRDEFIRTGLFVCAETAVVALAGAAGQKLIPIPVVGALIGSLAGKYLVGLAKDLADELDPKIPELEALLQDVIRSYDVAREFLELRQLRVEALIDDAFRPELNRTLLEASVALAEESGVHETLILRGNVEAKAFFTGKHPLNKLTAVSAPLQVQLAAG